MDVACATKHRTVSIISAATELGKQYQLCVGTIRTEYKLG